MEILCVEKAVPLKGNGGKEKDWGYFTIIFKIMPLASPIAVFIDAGQHFFSFFVTVSAILFLNNYRFPKLSTIWSLCIYFMGGRLDKVWKKVKVNLNYLNWALHVPKVRIAFMCKSQVLLKKRYFQISELLGRLTIEQIMIGKWEVRTWPREVAMITK